MLQVEAVQGGIAIRALSLDLRERIVEAYEAGEGSYEAIAERFSVGPTVVGKLVHQKRDLGTLAPQVHREEYPPILEEH